MQHFKEQAVNQQIVKRIQNSGVIAVVILDDIKYAIPLAQALIDGGIDILELTLRTPAAFEAARIIKEEFPEVLLGLGTVLTEDDVLGAVKVKADFGVAPGCNPTVIKAAQEHKLSFIPGISTPSDIEKAIELGCGTLKYFPAETSGGMKHLSAIAAPYQHLGLKYIPLGGLNSENADQYLASPLVAGIGGSWIADRERIKKEHWGEIRENALAIKKIIARIRV
ncbi:MAG: bifunctional 4-hydroxy-2-oxoglutarate aldolase/2-dehydro-3-deoxy-phosphogluconate aldolase [Cyclobacteriaceae bacterium]|nr:bifunctional 4-hydroxy-2-oxoglutarate aldolase/2-dehydro-3-deoxy-phosphogluconate aldolase [Cyclobacteriaceae bacterium]